MKADETTEETMHFDTTPRRASDPRMVIVCLFIGGLVGLCLAVLFLMPFILKAKEVIVP